MSEPVNRQYVNVPIDRVAVIIGKGGITKKEIESNTKTHLEIDSHAGAIVLETTKDTEDPLSIYRAKAVCEAIGKGFSPHRAFRLFNQEEMLKIIDLRDLVGKTQTNIKRIKGRIIGESGKARSMIEELTGTRISIYENTIAILGTLGQMRIAEEAIDMLIGGAFHKSVYKFLFNKQKALDRI
ncbi:MAG: KH domain-containing protein [Candidatus Ranarchaeia archaeon]